MFSEGIYAGSSYSIPFRLHFPEHYTEGEKYPLVLFLHGAGERGTNNTSQLAIGIMTALSDPESPLHECFIAAPQCPFDKQWVNAPWSEGSYDLSALEETPYLKAAHELCDYIRVKYPIDEKKNFVMGISMGGFGTWDSLVRYKGKFAGAMPCCGSGDPAKAELLKDTEIFAFHGMLDPTVPVSGSRDMVEAIKKSGGCKIHYKEYPELYHNCWDAAFSEFEQIKELMKASL